MQKAFKGSQDITAAKLKQYGKCTAHFIRGGSVEACRLEQ